MAKYEYNFLTEFDVDRLDTDLKELGKIIDTRAYREYIANKCLDVLDEICSYSLNDYGENGVMEQKVEEYKENHIVEHGNDYILIFNGTNLDQGEMGWVSEKTLPKYPTGISVAYIIEYGTGILGESQEDWETNVNTSYKRKGGSLWYHYDPDSYGSGEKVLVPSYSQSGKFIYLKLLETVKEKIVDWTNEYLKKKGW